ncbi:hypothetical protein NQ318_001351 [Aromia moschata]|uniref:Uncharacterized protein n=1 Tax=Aromia moschata TaxID=1265417 RepID=A0AAV8X9X3_9CUCU|nr:hypothetical protein NQ318_001351 [Aromia moschata]
MYKSFISLLDFYEIAKITNQPTKLTNPGFGFSDPKYEWNKWFGLGVLQNSYMFHNIIRPDGSNSGH